MKALPLRRRSVDTRGQLATRIPLWYGSKHHDSSTRGVMPPNWMAMVCACIRLISKRLSSMPLRVLGPDDQEMPVPLWLRQPNEWTTTRSMIDQSVQALLLHGAWTVLPVRDRSGRVSALVLPDPSMVTVEPRDGTGMMPLDSSGFVLTVGGERYNAEHVYSPWLTAPGDPTGISVVGALRDVTHIGARSLDHLGRFLDTGVVQQFAIKTKNVAQPQVDALAAQLKQKYAGPEKSMTPLIVPGDMDVEPLSMSMRDAQFMDFLQWSDVQICGVFGIDPTIFGIVQSGSQLTYNTTLHRELNLWRDALEPVAVIVEAALTRLLPSGQRVDLDESVYLRGTVTDKATMAATMAGMTVGGVHAYTVDEVRAVQGYAPNPDLPDAPTPTVTSPVVDDNNGDDDDADDD